MVDAPLTTLRRERKFPCCVKNAAKFMVRNVGPILPGKAESMTETWPPKSTTFFKARGAAERSWGELSVLVWRILGKLPANISANFDGEFFRDFFGLVFPRYQPPP